MTILRLHFAYLVGVALGSLAILGPCRQEALADDLPIYSDQTIEDFRDLAVHRSDNGVTQIWKADEISYAVVYHDQNQGEKEYKIQESIISEINEYANIININIKKSTDVYTMIFYLSHNIEEDYNQRKLISNGRFPFNDTGNLFFPKTKNNDELGICLSRSYSNKNGIVSFGMQLINTTYESRRIERCVSIAILYRLGIAPPLPGSEIENFTLMNNFEDGVITKPTERDLAVLRMLYDPRIKAGMTEDEAIRAVLPSAQQ